jgi:hypothetical protein
MRKEEFGRSLTRRVVRCVTILAGAVLLLSCTSFADELTVDCTGATPGAYTSIQDAIGALGPGDPTPVWNFHARHVITILSDCVERIPVYDRQGLTIQAPAGERVTITPPSPGGAVVHIGGSQGISLQRLVIGGAKYGIVAFDASEVDILDCTIENNSLDGLNVQGHSMVYFLGYEFPEWGAIRNNSGWGVSVWGSSEFWAWDATIEGNGSGGLSLGFGGTTWIHWGMAIRNNGTEGEPNSSGISVGNGSTLFMRGGEITDNHGPGILATANSNIAVGDSRIENNTGDGARVQYMSVARFGSGNTLTGNDDASIYCDSTSMAFGDLADIDGIECDTVEYQVTLCHIPPGNPSNAHTITVEESAVPAHLAHGDTLGPCDGASAGGYEVGIETGRIGSGLREPMFDPGGGQQANPTGSEIDDRTDIDRINRQKRYPRSSRRQSP